MAEASRVHVAVEHSMMRNLVVELLGVANDDDCRVITTSGVPSSPPDPPLRSGDVVIVDEAAWVETNCRQTLISAGARVIVVAAEDDPSSREVALTAADAWLPRSRLGDELAAEVQRIFDGPEDLDVLGRSGVPAEGHSGNFA